MALTENITSRYILAFTPLHREIIPAETRRGGVKCGTLWLLMLIIQHGVTPYVNQFADMVLLKARTASLLH